MNTLKAGRRQHLLSMPRVLSSFYNCGVGSKYPNPNQEQVVSAPDIPCSGEFLTGYENEISRALALDGIKSIVGEYAQTTTNEIEAGFDGIEVHATNGYLVDQSINNSSDNRTDMYGGSVENRGHFALEILDAVAAAAVGQERTAIRFSPGAYLHLIKSRFSIFLPDQKNTVDTLESYRKIWKGPFITTAGGFSTSLEFGHNIAEKTSDLIAQGRPFVANPDLSDRLCNGWELNPYDRDIFYSHDAKSYTDYPFYSVTN